MSKKIPLERLSGRKIFEPAGIRTTDLPIHNQIHLPLGYQALDFSML